MSEPRVSIVIPAYNEEARIVLTLEKTFRYLERAHPGTEVLVVDDGSKDGTAEIVQGIAERRPGLRLLRQPQNRGKGAAVRRGMLEARGELVLFMDADLATPIEELDKLLAVAEGADVVIGSRNLAGSDIREQKPLARRIISAGFQLLVRSVFMGGFRDTQCGFKLFRRHAAQTVFAEQTIDGFAFDVEILFLSRKHGFRIREVPVIWSHTDHSRVSAVADSSRVFADLMRLRARELRKRFE